jgi:hypothetical protein
MIAKTLFSSGVGAMLAFGSVGSFASITPVIADQYQLPGIVPSSLPAFETSVRVSYLQNSSGNRLTATFNNMAGYSNLVYPAQTFGIRNTKYQLTAVFDRNNVFQNGTVQIRGKIPGLVNGHSVQTLMTADLTAFASNTLGDLLGFNTANIVCHPDINAYAPCTTNESVYLDLKKGIFALDDGRHHGKEWDDKEGWRKSRIFRTTGLAITSIPVPAAVWLFGSGLLGLIGVARRKTGRNA